MRYIKIGCGQQKETRSTMCSLAHRFRTWSVQYYGAYDIFDCGYDVALQTKSSINLVASNVALTSSTKLNGLWTNSGIAYFRVKPGCRLRKNNSNLDQCVEAGKSQQPGVRGGRGA